MVEFGLVTAYWIGIRSDAHIPHSGVGGTGIWLTVDELGLVTALLKASLLLG